MPTIREIVAGYEAVNAWERQEQRARLSRWNRLPPST